MDKAIEDLKNTVVEAKRYCSGTSHHMEELTFYMRTIQEDMNFVTTFQKSDQTHHKDAEDVIRQAKNQIRSLEKLTFPLVRAKEATKLLPQEEEIEVQRTVRVETPEKTNEKKHETVDSPTVKKSSPTMQKSKRKRKTMKPVSSQAAAVREELYGFINKTIPKQYQSIAYQVAGEALLIFGNWEKAVELTAKPLIELENVVINRGIIEITENTFLRKPATKDISSMSRVSRWVAILEANHCEVQQLIEKIDADKDLTIENFPDYIALAYNRLSDKIHQYVNEEMGSARREIVDVPGACFGWPNAKKAVRMLFEHCFSPSSSYENSSESTPSGNVPAVSQNTVVLKPTHIRFQDTDDDPQESAKKDQDEDVSKGEIVENQTVESITKSNQSGNVIGAQNVDDGGDGTQINVTKKVKRRSDSGSEPEETPNIHPEGRPSSSKKFKNGFGDV